MQKEIELRIVDINRNEAVKRLREIHARHVAFRRFKRVEVRLIANPTLKRWIRLRTDGRTTRFAIKENRGMKENVYEHEIDVSDFKEMGKMMLKVFPNNLKAYVKSDRDEYTLDGAEITINKWPGIPPFMEIEGKSKRHVKSVWKKLRLKGRPIGNIFDVYRLYNKDFIKVNVKENSYINKMLK